MPSFQPIEINGMKDKTCQSHEGEEEHQFAVAEWKVGWRYHFCGMFLGCGKEGIIERFAESSLSSIFGTQGMEL